MWQCQHLIHAVAFSACRESSPLPLHELHTRVGESGYHRPCMLVAHARPPTPMATLPTNDASTVLRGLVVAEMQREDRREIELKLAPNPETMRIIARDHDEERVWYKKEIDVAVERANVIGCRPRSEARPGTAARWGTYIPSRWESSRTSYDPYPVAYSPSSSSISATTSVSSTRRGDGGTRRPSDQRRLLRWQRDVLAHGA